MDTLHRSKLRYTNRWFCYLDLLGFKDLVRTSAIEQVIPLYREVTEILAQQVAPKQSLGISHSWFSDTFIIFSRGDSEREFSLVEQAGRLFFQKLILSHIPVRGALTFGKLYSQLEQNIFIGDALIDAYEYGEKQAWLGFVLTPHVHEKLNGTSLELNNRIHYRKVRKVGVITHPNPENVYAFAFNNGLTNGQNPYLAAIRKMQESVQPQYKQKYLNTEEFILEHTADLLVRASA